MSDIDTLISEQETAVDLMTRAVISLKKKGNWKTKESSTTLRALRDGTKEVIDNLMALNRPVDEWDDILVHVTVMRLHPQTRRDWETQPPLPTKTLMIISTPEFKVYSATKNHLLLLPK